MTEIVDLRRRPHTIPLDVETLISVPLSKIRDMDDRELVNFCNSVGIQIRPDWNSTKIFHAITMAMYDASAAKIDGK